MLGGRSVLSQDSGSAGYGELITDRNGVLDLPRGFQYREISQEGTPLSSGGVVPGDHDGMAAFPGPSRNTAVLVRNREQGVGDPNPVLGKNPYDPAAPGGTTGIVVNLDDRKEIEDYVTSSGSLNNCAGGATPWGTWLTCEEDRTTGHGYVFEVDPNEPENELSRTPIRRWVSSPTRPWTSTRRPASPTLRKTISAETSWTRTRRSWRTIRPRRSIRLPDSREPGRA